MEQIRKAWLERISGLQFQQHRDAPVAFTGYIEVWQGLGIGKAGDFHDLTGLDVVFEQFAAGGIGAVGAEFPGAEGRIWKFGAA